MKNLRKCISIILMISILFTSNAFFTFSEGVNNETTATSSVKIVEDETTTIESVEEESPSENGETTRKVDVTTYGG